MIIDEIKPLPPEEELELLRFINQGNRKKILVVSDLHVGSSVAVMPDEVYIESDQGPNRIESNNLQKELYARWQGMLDQVGKVDACFVLGDCIDGPNYKSRGFELWTSSLHQQVTTACDLLGMVRTNKYYGVQGSFYHVAENTSSDLAVIDKLKGTFGSDLVVNIGEKRIHLCHEIGVSSSPVSKSTALQSELVFSELAEYFGKFDLLLRGHRHELNEVRNALGHICVCPGWKARDSFAAKKGLKFPIHIGYLEIEIQGSDLWVIPHLTTLNHQHLFKEVFV